MHNIYKITGEEIFQTTKPYINEIIKKERNIFLIGKDVKDTKSLRYKILKALERKKRANISISYPEDLFEEQLLQRNINLLSLENLLADSVDVIVLCVESPGSLTELGAFTNHDKLNNKLIVYIDKEFERNNSFINLGPVKFLKQKTDSKVHYIPFNQPFSENLINQLLTDISTVKRKHTVQPNLYNLFFCEKYLLALLYVFGRLARRDIIEIIKVVSNSDDKEKVEIIISTTDASLHTLLKTKKISLKGSEYLLNKNGIAQLHKEYPTNIIYNSLDNFSLKMLNLRYGKRTTLVI